MSRHHIKIGLLNVSKSLVKQQALQGERKEGSMRARFVVKNGTYKGVFEKGTRCAA